MVFGHNPGITEFANRLSAGEQIDNMPTCAVFTACFELADWSQLDWGTGLEAGVRLPAQPRVGDTLCFRSSENTSVPCQPQPRPKTGIAAPVIALASSDTRNTMTSRDLVGADPAC